MKPLRPLTKTRDDLAGSLLSQAGIQPPDSARSRILEAIEQEHSRLVDAHTFDPAAELLRDACHIEPPAGAGTRIWRRMQTAQTPQRSTRLRPIAVGALACAACAAILFLAHEPPMPAEADLPPLAYGVQSPSDPMPTAIPSVGEILALDERTAFRSEETDRGTRIHLEQGPIAIAAEQRSADAPLVVLAGEVSVRVVGTIFAVDRNGSEVVVYVRSGRVEVTHPGRTLELGRGEHWSNSGASPAHLVAACERLKEPPAPVAAKPTPSASTRTRVDVIPSGERKSPPETGPVSSHQDEVEDLSPDALRAQIREARRLGLGDLAAQAFQRLAEHPDEPVEGRANALASLAELLDESLAAPERAIDTWRELARIDNRRSGEALLGELHVRLELGHGERALEVAERCLSECEESGRHLAAFVRARLLQRAGRMDEARRAFAEARAAGERGDAIESAARSFYLRARRLHEHGQSERARVAARQSLALDPRGVHAAQARLLAGE